MSRLLDSFDSTLNQENRNTAIQTPLHILSLYGGGVRGLSSLLILNSLMTQALLQQNGHESNAIPKPAYYFDSICGSSTGALIAFMLGRLRMVGKTF